MGGNRFTLHCGERRVKRGGWRDGRRGEGGEKERAWDKGGRGRREVRETEGEKREREYSREGPKEGECE